MKVCLVLASRIKMQRTIEQRCAIKFYVKLNKSPTETFNMIRKAYKNEAMSRTRVFEWHKKFKDGREDVEDEERAGRPTSTRTHKNVAKVRQLLNCDRRLSVRLIAQELHLVKSTVYSIVTDDLQMRKVCAKLVPKVLSDEQKEHRVTICRELLECLEADPDLLDRVITGDETWIFEYDPETKRQSAEWHTSASLRRKKVHMSKSRVRSMLIVFFDKKVLERLRIRVRRVRREIADTWMLHHDNTPSYTSLIVREALTKHNIVTLPQPPYSPDMVPSDFFLFPRIKKNLKRHRFRTIEAVQAASTRCLNSLSVGDFQEAYEDWKKRWQRCIDAGGSYFEEY
ncbi:PREDICTED: putative uncharacterized protein FLJ37770 isoform X2 [Dinoponera quadriceps]|uniref:Mos1 transposase HTH domain-containing protein n=1 Tax=Dinoponera quadriceps TaxID=609295 RepID=A0A6P3Y8D3_DINQU|nr:PREDICTED: putative uncharacterized protein FLJ37770 isoform X2 [Dinoponera quadriceps]